MNPIDVYSTYIPYKKIRFIWSRLDDLRELRNGVHFSTQIKHMFIMGISRTGKSALAHEYIMKNPIVFTDEQLIRKAAFCEVPATFTTKALYSSILDALDVQTVGKRVTESDLKEKVIWHLRKQQVEVLFLDEMQHIINSKENRLVIMDTIKHIANISSIILVCMGYPSINDLRKSNLQYSVRFEPYFLRAFKDFDHDYCEFLFNLQKKLDYNKVPLYSPSNGLANTLYTESLGLVGLTVDILYEAMKTAFDKRKLGLNEYGIITKEIIKTASKIYKADREEAELQMLMQADLRNYERNEE